MLEDIVAFLLQRSRLSYVPQVRTGIQDDFDTEIVVDFHVKRQFTSAGKDHESFYIECKYQNSEGSVIHKLASSKDRTHVLDKPLVFIVWGDLQEKMQTYLARMIDQGRVPKGMMSVQNLHEATRWIASLGNYQPVARNPYDASQPLLDF